MTFQCAHVPLRNYSLTPQEGHLTRSWSGNYVGPILTWSNSRKVGSSLSAVIFWASRLTCRPRTGFPFFPVFCISFNCFVSVLFRPSFEFIQPHSCGFSLCYCPFSSAFQYLKCAIPAMEPQRTCSTKAIFCLRILLSVFSSFSCIWCSTSSLEVLSARFIFRNFP